MAYTYLEATNEILIESNEVELTSSNFSSAVGVQKFVKNIINRSYLDICAFKKTWPFLSYANSNANDPYAGNVSIETVAGQRWYLLKTGSTGIGTDFGRVDWRSFFATTEGATGATAPYSFSNLKFATFDEWFQKGNTLEAQGASTNTGYTMPSYVIASKDGRYFGLSSIPDKAYKIYFNAWVQPTKLSLHNDSILVPDKYVPVLLDKARYYMHQFKENEIQANLARSDYKQGLNKMALDLLGEEIKDFTDDRTRPI